MRRRRRRRRRRNESLCGAHRHKIEGRFSGIIHSSSLSGKQHPFCGSFFFFFFWLPAVLLLFSDVNNKHLQVEKTADTRQVPNCATAIIGRENARVRAPHDNNNNKPRSIGVVVPVVVVEDNHNTMATILSVVSASNYYRILRLSMICKDLRKVRLLYFLVGVRTSATS